MKAFVEIILAGLKFSGGAIEYEAPFVDKEYAGTCWFDLLQNMGREQNSFRFAQAPNRVAHFANLVWIESCRWFIHDE